MDPSPDQRQDTSAAERLADREIRGPALVNVLVALWLVMALGFAVVPFLTQFRVRTWPRDDVHEDYPDPQLEYAVNGWGQDGPGQGHGIRVGILFLVIAGLLILAAVATIGRRRDRWPIWLGSLAGTIGVTASVLHLVDVEASWHRLDIDTSVSRTDVIAGPGALLVPVLGVLSAVAVGLSFAWIRRLQHRAAPRRWTPETPRSDWLSSWLPGLWVVTAVGLLMAPFLPIYEVAPDGPADVTRIDGWGRTEGTLGVPCAVLATVLVIAAIAMAVRPTAAGALRSGLLAGTAAVVVGAFLLLRLDSVRSIADSHQLRISIGLGAWLALAAGILAAVTVGLALVRQRRLHIH